MSDVQGVEAELEAHEDVQITDTDTENVKDDAEVSNDDVEAVDEVEGDVDYQATTERLRKEREADQKKIDRQRAALSQTYEKMQALQQQIDEISKGSEQSKELSEPNIDEFEDFDSYTQAVKEYERNLVKKEVEAERTKELEAKKQEQYQQMMQQEQKAFQEAENAYKAENPDYARARKALEGKLEDYVPIDPSDMQGKMQYNQWSNELYDAAKEIGLVETIHFLGKNNGENLTKLDELRELSGVKLGMAMAKLAPEIKSAKPVKSKKEPPSKPVGKIKAAGKVNAELHDGLSTDEWMKRRNKSVNRR